MDPVVSFRKSAEEGFYLEVGDPDFSSVDVGTLSYTYVSDDTQRGSDWNLHMIGMTIQGKDIQDKPKYFKFNLH